MKTTMSFGTAAITLPAPAAASAQAAGSSSAAETPPATFPETLSSGGAGSFDKSSTSDMIEVGLSGTVNVQSARMLAIGKTTYSGSAGGVCEQQWGKLASREPCRDGVDDLRRRLGITATDGRETGWTPADAR